MSATLWWQDGATTMAILMGIKIKLNLRKDNKSGLFRCCTSSNPCTLEDGDCDGNSECAGSLVCGTDNCKEGLLSGEPASGGYPSSTYDCCIPP